MSIAWFIALQMMRWKLCNFDSTTDSRRPTFEFTGLARLLQADETPHASGVAPGPESSISQSVRSQDWSTGSCIDNPWSAPCFCVICNRTINIDAFIKGIAMTLRTSDVMPISEACARLTELADEVVGAGAEKVLTKNGSSFVAIVDARKLDYYHALEEEHASLVLLDEAETGLRQLLAGQRVPSSELTLALSDQ
ncbi:MAG: type II toxin-antitoxin system Phd/YefM family antitoxin [Thiobacillus sp.]|nr:type II toxin-antitoxin system Phd/YefM family antitoxin [Thiobacillus sp.]